MKYNPEKHHRRSIRLRGYDYSSAGLYHVTICTENKNCLFGDVLGDEMILNDNGKIAKQCWLEIPQHFPQAQTDEFIIMPNHIHGIIVLSELVGKNNGENFSDHMTDEKCFFSKTEKPSGTSKTIGSIVRGFKIGVTKWFRQNTDIYVVWQRNYYESIIRANGLNSARQYIINNPNNWKDDEHYVINI